MKWYTTVERVDIETGEVITQKTFENNYQFVKKEISYEYNEKTSIKKICWVCRKIYDTNFFDELDKSERENDRTTT